MSSTSAVGTPISVASSVSSNVPSPSSSPSNHTPSSSSGVNTVSSVSLLTSVTTLPTGSLTTSPSSKQHQQPSSASQNTMSATATTPSVPTSESPSVPSSITVPSASAQASSVPFSIPLATTASSSDGGRSTTLTPETSIQPTSPSTASAPAPTQSSALKSSSLTIGTTVSSALVSTAAPSTSNMPSTVSSSPLSSDSSSRSSSPARTEIPLTTVLESTTTLFVTSTNNQGQVMTSEPPVVTEVITTTGSGGMVTTVTQAIVNPTLASNNSTSVGSSFFADTGAVTGVFVVVGLASAAIMMWILFAIRRRQRMRRIEQDTAVEAAVAAAGLNRAPLDDDYEEGSPISPNTYHQFSSGMGQRSTPVGRGSDSLPTSARLSEVLDDMARDSSNSQTGFSVEHHSASHPEGYVPARTSSPSPRAERCTVDLGSSRDRKSSYGHTPTYSAGSFEPLLANYVQGTSDQDNPALVAERPQNRPSQHSASGLASNGYSSDGSHKDESRRTSLKGQNSSDGSDLRDEEDYTRSVLMVRNIPDNQSQHSL